MTIQAEAEAEAASGSPARSGAGTMPSEEPMDPLMTIEEVADYLRVPILTIRWLRQEGRFCPAVKIGRRLTWERSAIRAWVEAQREVAL